MYVEVPGPGRLRPPVRQRARPEADGPGGPAEDWLCRLVVREVGQTSLHPGLGPQHLSPDSGRDVEKSSTQHSDLTSSLFPIKTKSTLKDFN